jgi:hypothetical protein
MSCSAPTPVYTTFPPAVEHHDVARVRNGERLGRRIVPIEHELAAHPVRRDVRSLPLRGLIG